MFQISHDKKSSVFEKDNLNSRGVVFSPYQERTLSELTYATGKKNIAICNDNPFEFGLFARHGAQRKAVETQIENFVSNIEQCLRKVGYQIFEARPCYNCANIFIKKGDVIQTVTQEQMRPKTFKTYSYHRDVS